MDERELEALNESISVVAAGDCRGIDEIYRAVGGRMLSVALGIVKNRSVAEDVVQDSFLKIAKSAGSFRRRENGYAWILKIVKNTALNRRKAELLRAGPVVEDLPFLSDNSEETARTERSLLCGQALAGLDELEHRIVYQKYFADMTVREIARLEQIPKSTVQHIADRAEAKMRRILGLSEP